MSDAFLTTHVALVLFEPVLENFDRWHSESCHAVVGRDLQSDEDDDFMLYGEQWMHQAAAGGNLPRWTVVMHLGGHNNCRDDVPPGAEAMWNGLRRMKDFALAWRAFGYSES